MVRILFFCLTALAGVSFADSAYGSENLRESCADLVLNGLGGRKWLACSASGPLTDAIAERAAQRGIELHIAPLGGKAYDAPSYGTFISGVKALGSPRLTAAAAYGGGAAFVRVWRTFSGDEVMKTFGFISSPELFRADGYVAVPSGLVVAMYPEQTVTREFLKRAYDEFSETADMAAELIMMNSSDGEEMEDVVKSLGITASFAGNMMGAALYNAGMLEEAYAAFNRAWMMNNANLPAFFNVVKTVQEGVHKERSEWLKSMFAQMENSDLRDRMVLEHMAMSAMHGYMVGRKVSEVDAWKGWEMMATAIPGFAGTNAAVRLAESRKDLTDDAQRAVFRDNVIKVLETVYYVPDSDMKKYGEFPVSGGMDFEKAAGLARELLADGDVRGAAFLVSEAAAVNAAGIDGLMDEFTAAAQSNSVQAAAVFLSSVPENLRGRSYWRQMLEVCNDAEDIKGMIKSAEMLLKYEGDTPEGKLIAQALEGWRKFEAGDVKGASEILAGVHKAAPDSELFYRTLLLAMMFCGDVRGAASAAGEMLAKHPDSAYPNYVMASAALSAGDNKEAEKYFSAIFDNGRGIPVNVFMVNDYAMMLCITGRGAVSEAIVRKFLAATGIESAFIYDTLATAVRVQGGRGSEALELYLKALEMPGGDDPRVLLNAAEMILETGGSKEQAADFLKKASGNIKAFNEEEKSRYEKACSEAGVK